MSLPSMPDTSSSEADSAPFSWASCSWMSDAGFASATVPSEILRKGNRWTAQLRTSPSAIVDSKSRELADTLSSNSPRAPSCIVDDVKMAWNVPVMSDCTNSGNAMLSRRLRTVCAAELTAFMPS